MFSPGKEVLSAAFKVFTAAAGSVGGAAFFSEEDKKRRQQRLEEAKKRNPGCYVAYEQRTNGMVGEGHFAWEELVVTPHTPRTPKTPKTPMIPGTPLVPSTPVLSLPGTPPSSAEDLGMAFRK